MTTLPVVSVMVDARIVAPMVVKVELPAVSWPEKRARMSFEMSDGVEKAMSSAK